jgi:HSP90 family molecular chaperone
MPALDEKQNITLRLSRKTIQKARVLAAQRSTSISGLLTSQIEQLAEKEDDYERAMDRAFARMEKGFHMGKIPKLDRDALHERR